MHFDWSAPTVWERLRAETRPILLYGMGDGADKILRVFAAKGIRAAGVFASDGFVRGHSFAGFPVRTLDASLTEFGEDVVIVLCFGSHLPELLARFDALDARFDLFAPDVPVAGEGLFDRAFVRAHRDELRRAYELLADEQSRQVFECTLAYKLSGRIGYLRACESDPEEVYRLLSPGGEERVVDLGAYNGDTLRELLLHTGGRFASIDAVEPDRRSFRKLERYAAESLTGEVRLWQTGVWSCDGEQSFAGGVGRGSTLGSGGESVTVRAVDSLLDGRGCTLLKLDVEGAEREALLGARETILRCRPRIRCAVYHRNEDLFALPLLLHALRPDYRLYLRRYPSIPAWDTEVYAL